jgi:hypothetical protein
LPRRKGSGGQKGRIKKSISFFDENLWSLVVKQLPAGGGRQDREKNNYLAANETNQQDRTTHKEGRNTFALLADQTQPKETFLTFNFLNQSINQIIVTDDSSEDDEIGGRREKPCLFTVFFLQPPFAFTM